MTINKIGNINSIQDISKNRSVKATKEIRKNDSIKISNEAKEAAEIAKYNQIINETSDIRTEKVAKIKEQIENGTYDFDDHTKLNVIANKIANSTKEN